MQHFEQEVSRFAALDHPHLVRIHNVSFCEGTYFLVTDCVVDPIGETTNLGQFLSERKERPKEEELLSIAKQIADALDFVHEKGVIHGCLTLGNILIGKGSPAVEVCITDLGLLKLVHPAGILARSFQAVAENVGLESRAGDERYKPTPIEGEKFSKLAQTFMQGYAFLAPEQKSDVQMTQAVDAYAYGILLYYMITKTYPEGIFEPISAIAPEYRFDWDMVINSCLHRDPKGRPELLSPLLERTKMQTISVDAQPRTFHETQKEEPQVVEAIKEQLAPKEEPQLVAAGTPVIEREEVVKTPSLPTAASVVVEKKDLTEATAAPVNPTQDAEYSNAIKSMFRREPVVTQYQPRHEEKSEMEPLQTEMVVMPAGEYIRGSNEGNRDESPCHKILLESFALDIHPVTNEQFSRFLEYMGGEKDQNYNDIIRLKESRINRAGGRLSIESGYAKHPVVGVTWYGAVAYAKWVGKRLPTEAEWEIAAIGGLGSVPYSTGINIEKNQGNFFSSDTTSVKSYAPNAYGLYDMAGNVYEWCQDWYGYNYYESSQQEPDNPKGPLQGVYRVLRGGCWKSLKEDMRCSHRHRNNPGTVNGTYGFRCAANVK